MKRFFLLGFSILYIGLVSGLSIQVHYCLGKTRNISLVFTPPKPCSCPLDEDGNPMGCCHDDQIKYAADELTSRVGVEISESQVMLTQIDAPIAYECRLPNSEHGLSFPSLGRSGQSRPAYLLYQSLTFYG